MKLKLILNIIKYCLHPSDACLDCNKALSDISDSDLCSLITDVYKPPKHSEFPETEQPFRFVRFDEFPRVVIFGGTIVFIAYLVFFFVIILWEFLSGTYLQKSYRTWPTAPTAVKTFKNQMQSQILLTRFTDEYSDKKVSINKIFDLKHKENIKKARETLLSLYRL